MNNLDVKIAFIYGDLEEEIYIEQLEGFKAQGKEDLVCRLKEFVWTQEGNSAMV